MTSTTNCPWVVSNLTLKEAGAVSVAFSGASKAGAMGFAGCAAGAVGVEDGGGFGVSEGEAVLLEGSGGGASQPINVVVTKRATAVMLSFRTSMNTLLI